MNGEFLMAVLKRALWTFCESLLAVIPVGVGIEEVSWLHVLSVAVMAAILSALKSIATGLPEAKSIEEGNE